MTKIIPAILAGLVLGAALTWTVLHRGEHEQDAHKEADEHAAESHVLHTNDQTFVKLNREAQEKAGLQVAPLEAASLPSEIRAVGRVLDPASLVVLLIEGTTARAQLEASQREFERLQVLARDQNTSARLLEAAAAARQRDQIAVDAAHLKLVTGWGRAVAGQQDLAAFVGPLAAQETALVRLDVPLGEALKDPPTGARVAMVSAPETPMEAQLLGPAPGADPQTQGQGYLCLVKGGALVPATAVLGWLSRPGQPEEGVLLPRAALVRHEGEAFVYVQTAPELFLRHEVELEHPTAQGWFVAEGLKPGQKIVIVGAQQLLSEELKGEGGEE